MGSTVKPLTPRGAIGGASGDAGVEYRRAVAAYAVAHGLADVSLSGFGVPPNVANVSAVSVETDDLVDDVAIEFESGWRATVQAKRTLKRGAPFKSAMAQWKRAAQRGLQTTERVVLVTGDMPNWAHDLKRLLERYKTDKPGSPTKAETTALGYLDAELQGLTAEQRERLLKSASIHILLVEEQELQQSREAIRLLDTVVGKATSAQAWRDLVVLAGKTARIRGGFLLQGWMDLLLADGQHEVLTSQVTAAAQLMRRKAARDRYCSLVRQRGSIIDLRPLGATIPPIPLDRVDAGVEAVVPGEDERTRRDLLWAFLRRGRMVLTGLPGGGKSLALSIVAAQLLEVPDAPFPVVASLREIDRRDRTVGFRDRLLDVAVKDLPTDDRPLIRAEIEDRLANGSVALLLDSLDETHGRRAQVVAELHDFVESISNDVDILLATREVAYGYAATLGWPDLRLAPPKDIARTVRAILDAQAATATPAEGENWVRTRDQWVTRALKRDKSLSETPLLPILLSLLAITKNVDALPKQRALILHAVVKAIVERQEARQDAEFHAGLLSGKSAAKAILDGFTVEATNIAAHGGQCQLEQLLSAVRSNLQERWGLLGGSAEVTAEAIARFWDETGIFVISGADELVAPRVELFVEIGEAVHITQRHEGEVSHWVGEAAEAGRHEPLVLAAGLSDTVAREVLRVAATAHNYQLLLAAMTALRQGAAAAEPEFGEFIKVLAQESRGGDAEAWRVWSQAIRLPLSHDLMGAMVESIEYFSVEHQAIARAVLLLRGHLEETPVGRKALLLDALRVRRLPALPWRGPNSHRGYALGLVDNLFNEAIEGAAAELLGRTEEATALVVDALERGSISMSMHERLCELLRRHGFDQLVEKVTRERWAKFDQAFAGLAEFDRDIHKRLLSDLAAHLGAALNNQERTRLDELAALCETLNLDNISAWPRSGGYHEWFWPLVKLVQQLGSFDSAVISAQATLTLDRMETLRSDDPFYYIFDQVKARRLDAWDMVEDRGSAVRLLVSTFFRGEGAAWVAARALWKAPVADLAVPLLAKALPQLQDSPAHQGIAALTMLSLTGGQEINEWITDGNVVLRMAAAQWVPLRDGQSLRSEVVALLHDFDGHVVETVIDRLGGMMDSITRAELERIAQQANPGWMCLSCRTQNRPGGRSCSQCHVGGPDPAVAARALLNGTERPVRVVLDLDDLDE